MLDDTFVNLQLEHSIIDKINIILFFFLQYSNYHSIRIKVKMTTVLFTVIIFYVLFYLFWVPLGQTTDPCGDVKQNAKIIVDSKFNEATVAEIITKLTPEQCMQLNTEIANANGGVPLIDAQYVPYKDNGSIYKDLLFALVTDPTIVLAKYNGEFMGHKD